MIVLGADTHKSSHTVAAVNVATGQLLDDKTVQVGARGFSALLAWARSLDRERVWALEDCRHVCGVPERFVIARGERVVRVWTRLMAGTRRSSRERGKSDQIDATAVARAALAAGIQTLPTAALAGPELDLRLLVDHRERLLRIRSALNNTLQWNLHDLWPELKLPGSSLFYAKWSTRIARRLARAEQTMRVRIARASSAPPARADPRDQRALETEISELVAAIAPQLLDDAGADALGECDDRGVGTAEREVRVELDELGDAVEVFAGGAFDVESPYAGQEGGFGHGAEPAATEYRLPDGRRIHKTIGPAWTQRGRPATVTFTKPTAEAWLRDVLDGAPRRAGGDDEDGASASPPPARTTSPTRSATDA